MSAPSLPASRTSVIAGIALSAASYLLFSMHDATVKWLVADFSPLQLLFVRSAVILAFCLAVGGPRVALRAASSPIRLALLWRGVLLFAAWLCYYTAARYLQLAELVTIYFSAPLLVAVLAILILKEQVGRSRWASLAIGFIGVIVACRPGGMHQPLPIALALAAAMLWAYSTVLIRQIVHAESTPVLMLVTNGTFFVVCGALMIWHWRAPDLGPLLLMVLVGVLAAVAQYVSTEAIRRAPASVVAVISFSSLIWSFCLGLAIWGDVPGTPVFVGAGLIVISGLLVAGVEWRRIRGLRRAALAGANEPAPSGG